MYCPSCGQEQVSEETRFCSRCGLLLTSIAAIMNNGGVLPQNLAARSGSKLKSLRKKGVKQGLFIFLLTFLVVPITAIIAISLRAGPFPIAISAVLLSVGGLLRMIYALMFEADEELPQTISGQNALNVSDSYFDKTNSDKALPPEQSIPVSSYMPPKQGNWRDTNDLAQPSVTEGTTKLLQDE